MGAARTSLHPLRRVLSDGGYRHVKVLAVLRDEPSRSALISATEGCGLMGAPSLPSEVGNALIAGYAPASESPW